ncbi:MAG: ROK family protein [Romboutsia sp.]|uniref:ROK family protein n=1 Tax=Romboutsia sp. TaxID=1965302 RepID=UPI003F3DB1EA
MYNIGVDVGGTSVKAGLVKEGEIVFKNSQETDKIGGVEALANNIISLVNEIVEKCSVKIEEVGTIGIGVPGMVNKHGEIVCVNIGIKNGNLIELLEKEFPTCKIDIANDANVAALAEYAFGSMKGYNSGIMLTLGTGVGSGIIINGKLVTGAHGIGAEIGHITIDKNYFDCNCGNNGCFETFCSATAIIKYAQKLIGEGRESLILEKAKNIENITAKDVFDSYREKDIVAVEVIDRFKNYLGLGIGNIINFIDPDVISIGGGVSNASDIIFDGLEEIIRKYVVFKGVEIADVVIAKFKNDAGILGASAL